jgi:phage terminase large subunit
MYYDFSPYLFNPLYWHLLPLLRDERIRYIFIEGGSSAAKTYTICQALATDMYENEYSTMCFRRFQINIADSVYSSFKAAIKGLDMEDYYIPQQLLIKGEDDKSRIRFRGLDDEENIKGIEDFSVVYNNEWSQFIEDHWTQQRKRLRGKPNQKFICDWNPISSKLWQYENWIDKDEWTDLPLNIPGKKFSQLNPDYAFKRINKKGNSVWIKVTFRDNYWICGHPEGKGGYLDQHTLDDYEYDRVHKPNMYRIYANGERGIIRTGGEFWKQFDETKHVKPLKVEKTTVHISLDENVTPYITTSIWQIEGKKINQVHEIACKSPDNNAPKAAKKLANWLHSIDYRDLVYIYGDPSAGKRSTVDANNSSFYDKYIEVLRNEGFHVVNRVARSAPEVALSAAFINEIYESNLNGYEITISDSCKVSIDDYCTVKEDKDGKMDKPKVKDEVTGVTYEPQGHFSDAKRYLITTILKE